MHRRNFLALSAGTVLWPFASSAEQKLMPVIGFLGVGSPGGFAVDVAGFQQGLKDSGWMIGQNVAVEYRWAEGHFDHLPNLAGELVERKVSVIATSGGALAAHAAKNATDTIPIVFETGIDPVEAGLVQSFAHPGGNLTGVRSPPASSIQSASICFPSWSPTLG